jgi:hypothetical protein
MKWSNAQVASGQCVITAELEIPVAIAIQRRVQMHKCHNIRCLAKVQFEKWEPIWNGTAKEINTIVIDFTKEKN